MYYIMKTAVYDHGVLWIGEDLEEGKAKADYFANNHDDGHHRYVVREFAEPVPASVEDWERDWEEGSTDVYTAKSPHHREPKLVTDNSGVISQLKRMMNTNQ